MKEDYNLIIGALKHKLNNTELPDYIKFLYHKKIMLLKDEMILSETTLKNMPIETSIQVLDNELNTLINLSKQGMPAVNSFISNKMVKVNKLNVDNHKKANAIKRKLITYLLTLSVVLTTNAFAIEREKNKNKEVLFDTERYTYHDYSNTVDNTKEYLPKSDTEALMIKRITPWVVRGTQGKRTIYTYKITNMSIEEILISRDYEGIVNNLDCIVENEYKYKNELRDYDRYEEPIYEVVYQTQDYHDYLVKYPNLNTKKLALLLCDILIYILMININNGPLIESLLYDIKELQQSDKQLAIDYEIITSYRKKLLNNNK